MSPDRAYPRAGRAALLVGLALVAALGLSAPALAQEISIDLGEGGQLTGRLVQLFLVVTVLSLAPGIVMMVTCFPFMVTVLSILRQAIGLQAAPPNMLLVSLALFLTYFVMEPVFAEAWRTGVEPMMNNTLSPEAGFREALKPFRVFMEARVDKETVAHLLEVAPQATREAASASGQTPLSVLTPAFMLSEIKRAFEIGFMIFLPFLVIDLVIASVLMAMGMMMVPPAVVSLPFKLAFFVMADGWSLLAGALVSGYSP